MILITGSGRAGTSITARLFELLGFDLGANNRWFDKYRAGYEPLGIVRLNEAIIASGVWGRSYTPPEQRDALAHRFRARMHELAARQEVAKDPRFTVTLDLWLRAGVPIEYMVVCIRSPEECIESAAETGAGFAIESPESMLRGYHELIARIGCLFQTLALHGIPFGVVRYDHYIEDFLKLDLPMPSNTEEVLRENFKPSQRTHSGDAWHLDLDAVKCLGQEYPSSFPSNPEPPEAVQHDFERVVNWIHPEPPRLPLYEVVLPGGRIGAVQLRIRASAVPEIVVQSAVFHVGGQSHDLLAERSTRIGLVGGEWVRKVPGGELMRFTAAGGRIQFKRLCLHKGGSDRRLVLHLIASDGASLEAEAVDLLGGRTAVPISVSG